MSETRIVYIDWGQVPDHVKDHLDRLWSNGQRERWERLIEFLVKTQA